jgi:TolA-binding protein
MRLILRRLAWALVLSVLGNGTSARADAGDDQFILAAGHYRQQRWQEACDELSKMLAAHPDHPRANQARFFYGEALSQLGRWKLAQSQFGELLRRDPNHRYARQALFRSGETAYFGGDPRTAKHDLQAFREKFPQDSLNGYALPYLASLALRAENAAGARELFSAALEQFPAGPLVEDCRLGVGQAYEQLGQLERAKREYQQVADSPLTDQALLHLGTLDNALGNQAAALASFERLATMFPDSTLQADARLGRGYTLYKLGRYHEAEVLLQRLADDPRLRVDAHYWLGLSQRARGEWGIAAKTLSAGSRLDESHRLSSTLGFHAADALLRDAQWEAARDEFDRVLSHWPQGPWADDCELGRLHSAAERHEYADCVRLADELATKFPDSPLVPQAELAKGQALFALGQYAQAVDPLASLLKRKASPPDPPNGDDRGEALSILALCHAKLGRFAEANQGLTALRAENARDT